MYAALVSSYLQVFSIMLFPSAFSLEAGSDDEKDFLKLRHYDDALTLRLLRCTAIVLGNNGHMYPMGKINLVFSCIFSILRA